MTEIEDQKYTYFCDACGIPLKQNNVVLVSGRIKGVFAEDVEENKIYHTSCFVRKIVEIEKLKGKPSWKCGITDLRD